MIAATVAALLAAQQPPSAAPPREATVRTIVLPDAGAESTGNPSSNASPNPPEAGHPEPFDSAASGQDRLREGAPAAERSRGAPTQTPPEPETRGSPSSRAQPTEDSRSPDAQDNAREEQDRQDARAAAEAQWAAQQEQLRAEVEALRSELRAQQARADALEARLAERDAEDSRRAAERAASTVSRAESTGATLGALDSALRSLSTGDAGGVDAALAAQADALERTRREAQTHGALEEAVGTGASATAIAEAREALSRGDLYTARVALWRAALAARSANALAREGASAPAAPGR